METHTGLMSHYIEEGWNNSTIALGGHTLDQQEDSSMRTHHTWLRQVG